MHLAEERKPFSTFLRRYAIGETVSMTLAGWGLLTTIAWGTAILSNPIALLPAIAAFWFGIRSLGLGAGYVRTLIMTVAMLIAMVWISRQDLGTSPVWLRRGVLSPLTLQWMLIGLSGIDLVDCFRAKLAKPN